MARLLEHLPQVVGAARVALVMVDHHLPAEAAGANLVEEGRAFGVAKLPYAVLLDENGKVASLGLINSREHLESLFEAKERGVASIQDFLARRKEA